MWTALGSELTFNGGVKLTLLRDGLILFTWQKEFFFLFRQRMVFFSVLQWGYTHLEMMSFHRSNWIEMD